MENTNTIEITLDQGIGYTGKLGNKVWVAEITGTEAKYGFAREFVFADSVTRDHFGRSRYIRTYSYRLPVGLYEYSASGERTFLLVCANKAGELKGFQIGEGRADAIARLMDAGESFNDARLATRPADK